jgi:lactoylglutathione lyase
LTLELVSQFPDWHHVLFKVKDADVSLRFYSEYVGLTAIVDQKDTEGNRWVWMRFLENPYAPLFVLMEDSKWKKSDKAVDTSFQRMGFRMSDLEPVEALSEKAKKENCLMEAAHYGGHLRGYFCVVTDPDGNQLEFSYFVSPKGGSAF